MIWNINIEIWIRQWIICKSIWTFESKIVVISKFILLKALLNGVVIIFIDAFTNIIECSITVWERNINWTKLIGWWLKARVLVLKWIEELIRNYRLLVQTILTSLVQPMNFQAVVKILFLGLSIVLISTLLEISLAFCYFCIYLISKSVIFSCYCHRYITNR